MIKCAGLMRKLREAKIKPYNLLEAGIIGGATYNKINKGEASFNLATLDKMCEYFSCQPGDLIEYVSFVSIGKKEFTEITYDELNAVVMDDSKFLVRSDNTLEMIVTKYHGVRMRKVTEGWTAIIEGEELCFPDFQTAKEEIEKYYF